MKFEYETQRLILKVLEPNAENAQAVLDFQEKNRAIFERYEAARPSNFYTQAYTESVLSYEYDLFIRMKSIRFWIFEKTNPDKIIGTICFYNITHSIYERCETGYKLDPAFWHNGYAKEAMELGMYLMFEELNLHRIEAYVMAENVASIHLLESLHFQYEGTCRQAIKVQNNWEDHLLYACIR